MIYTAQDLIAATGRANDEQEFPLEQVPETARVLGNAISPALDDLPLHLQCERVELALKTVFTMGVAAGIELERGS